MTTGLIQNYIADRMPKGHVQNKRNKSEEHGQPNKPMPYFNIRHELDNKTFIKPLEGKGRLLNENIFNAPAIMVKDAIYDAKSLKHAVAGNANDHELGRINDIGLKLGGLAIAGYLFTKKQTPMTKGMEFIGLASFLASMAIWPKIAIQLPAYLIHGINVQKQYEDSFGRKKSFYQDPQFIPWDLYSDEEIKKMGNRLGVPKDIPNRRDAIQEKMRKIATQNNTLWMLTAGFATPIMSALICNQTEPYLSKYLDKLQNKKADKIISNLDKYSEKYKTNEISKNLEKIIDLYRDKPVNAELKKLLNQTFTNGMDLVTAEGVKADLKMLLDDTTYEIDEKTAKEISKNLREKLSEQNFNKEFIRQIIPDEDKMIQIFKENHFMNQKTAEKDLGTISQKILFVIRNNVLSYNESMPEGKKEDLNYIIKLLANNKEKNHPIKKALKKVSGSIFNSRIIETLKKVASLMDDFRAKTNSLDEYACIKVGAAPETVIANYWTNTQKDLLKIIGISKKDIEKTHFDIGVIGKLVRNKFEKIVSDKKTYLEVMDKIAQKISELDTLIKPSDISASLLRNGGDMPQGGAKTAYESTVDAVFNRFAKAINKTGFKQTAKTVAGVNPNDNVGTLKNLQKAYASDRLLGVKSSFLRLYNTLYFYRRVAEKPNDFEYLQYYTREGKEEIIEFCKQFLIDGHSSDYATKFYMPRNPHPSEDRTPLEVKEGKIVNAYYGKTEELADIAGDKYFYQDIMRTLFETEIDDELSNILDKHLFIKEEFENYRSLILNKIGGEKYFAKPRHMVRPDSHAGSELKFNLTGIAMDEFFYKAAQQTYNTNKWLKMFAGFGAGLLGVTVLTQFFFGKMKYNRETGKKQ